MEKVPKKVNILFMLPTFDRGGSEKLVVELATHLDPHKFNPVICVFFSGAYEKTIRNTNIPFYVVNKNGIIKKKIETLKFINSIIRKYNIDIVNTHHPSALLQSFPSCKFFNHVKVVHTEHTRLDYHSDILSPKHLIIEKFFLRFTDAAIGISQELCNYLQEKLTVSQEKIVKIINGVDINQFQISDEIRFKLRSEYRTKLGIKDNNIVIGMCANFRKQKNHPNLISAAEILRKRGINNFRITLVGEGPELINIKTMVQDLHLNDYVIFLGSRSDVPMLMAMFDIYCLPSFFEGLPLSLIESMAAGLPSVATDVDGNREVIVNGQSGLLVANNDLESLTNALEKLIKNEDLRKKMGKFALEHSLKFSLSTMVNQYENLFYNLSNRQLTST